MLELIMVVAWLRAHVASAHATSTHVRSARSRSQAGSGRRRDEVGASIVETVVIIGLFVAAAIVIVGILVTKATDAANSVQTQ